MCSIEASSDALIFVTVRTRKVRGQEKRTGIFFHLPTADALVKLLIEKGLITEVEFMHKLSAERAEYQAVLETDRGPRRKRLLLTPLTLS